MTSAKAPTDKSPQYKRKIRHEVCVYVTHVQRVALDV